MGKSEKNVKMEHIIWSHILFVYLKWEGVKRRTHWDHPFPTNVTVNLCVHYFSFYLVHTISLHCNSRHHHPHHRHFKNWKHLAGNSRTAVYFPGKLEHKFRGRPATPTPVLASMYVMRVCVLEKATRRWQRASSGVSTFSGNFPSILLWEAPG